MVSYEHEFLVEIFREHPELVLDLLRTAFGVDASGDIEVAPSSENLTTLQPPERRADSAPVQRVHGNPRPRRALVIEVQLQSDPDKRSSWPIYVAVARARLRCPVTLVAVTLDAATARWCAEPIELDENGSALYPLVLGPSSVPIVDARAARRHPELAALSLLAHRDEPSALDLGRALLSACADLDSARAELYTDIVLGFINEAARRVLEAEMNLENYEVQSEFFRNLMAKAKAQGGLEFLARAVLRVLDARSLPVTDEQRLAINACTDPDELFVWLQRAATAGSTGEIFAP